MIDNSVSDLKTAVDVPRNAATGQGSHVYQGLCLDKLEGHDSRALDCEVCNALVAIDLCG